MLKRLADLTCKFFVIFNDIFQIKEHKDYNNKNAIQKISLYKPFQIASEGDF